MTTKENTMITSQTQPLEIASRELSAETIKAIRQSPSFGPQSWKILDRWAFNSPMELKQLESEGELVLLGKVLEQQRLELEAMHSLPAEHKAGLTEHEVLVLQEVNTEL
jgi:hypothetical protein